jgi:hypothetical protein
MIGFSNRFVPKVDGHSSTANFSMGPGASVPKPLSIISPRRKDIGNDRLQ